MKNLLKTLFVAAAALSITFAQAQTDRTKEVKDTTTEIVFNCKTIHSLTNPDRNAGVCFFMGGKVINPVIAACPDQNRGASRNPEVTLRTTLIELSIMTGIIVPSIF